MSHFSNLNFFLKKMELQAFKVSKFCPTYPIGPIHCAPWEMNGLVAGGLKAHLFRAAGNEPALPDLSHSAALKKNALRA